MIETLNIVLVCNGIYTKVCDTANDLKKHVMYVENILTALRKSLKNELYFEQLFEKSLVKDFKSWYRKLPIKAHMFYLNT